MEKDDRVITSICCGHSFTLTLSQHKKIADDIYQSNLYHSKVAQMQESQQKVKNVSFLLNESAQTEHREKPPKSVSRKS